MSCEIIIGISEVVDKMEVHLPFSERICGVNRRQYGLVLVKFGGEYSLKFRASSHCGPGLHRHWE